MILLLPAYFDFPLLLFAFSPSLCFFLLLFLSLSIFLCASLWLILLPLLPLLNLSSSLCFFSVNFIVVVFTSRFVSLCFDAVFLFSLTHTESRKKLSPSFERIIITVFRFFLGIK